MRAGSIAVGALNTDAQVPDGFGEEDAALAGDAAAAGAAVLVNISAYWTAFDLTTQLFEALGSRAVVEQAKGILMASRPQLSPGEASDMLRKASQRENVKLRDVAARIVERRTLRNGELENPR